MGLRARRTSAIVALGCLLGCAGFSYRHYGLGSDISYEHGTLLGPEPKDDIPFSRCAPIEGDKSPCIIMQTDAFLRLKRDYLDLQARLKECESRGDR